MNEQKVSATDFARGKHSIARVSLVSVSEGFPISLLDQWLAKGPTLKASDKKSMINDLRESRSKLTCGRISWD